MGERFRRADSAGQAAPLQPFSAAASLRPTPALQSMTVLWFFPAHSHTAFQFKNARRGETPT